MRNASNVSIYPFITHVILNWVKVKRCLKPSQQSTFKKHSVPTAEERERERERERARERETDRQTDSTHG